jgi:hypothetical protein
MKNEKQSTLDSSSSMKYEKQPTLDSSSSMKNEKQPTINPRLSTKLLCGAIAGVIGTLAIYPLDIIKTNLQNHTSSYSGMIDCGKSIYNRNGPRGFYKGLLVII